MYCYKEIGIGIESAQRTSIQTVHPAITQKIAKVDTNHIPKEKSSSPAWFFISENQNLIEAENPIRSLRLKLKNAAIARYKSRA
jgi:hypothetical protein